MIWRLKSQIGSGLLACGESENHFPGGVQNSEFGDPYFPEVTVTCVAYHSLIRASSQTEVCRKQYR